MVHTCVESMSTATYSSSTPWSRTSESEFESNQEHNMWNEIMSVLAHHECSLGRQRCLSEGELCRVALSSHFSFDILTVGNESRSSGRSRSDEAKKFGIIEVSSRGYGDERLADHQGSKKEGHFLSVFLSLEASESTRHSAFVDVEERK